MPIVGSSLHVWLYNVPLGIVAFALIVFATTKRGDSIVPVDGTLLFAGGFLVLALIVQTLRGNGFITLALGGQLVLFTLAFLQFFGRVDLSVNRFIEQISTIYKIHLVAIAIEGVIVVGGGQGLLTRLLNGPPNYKNYNPADVLQRVFPQVGGLNSLLLGSQGAAMLTLFAFLWFLNPLDLRARSLRGRGRQRWRNAAGVLFVISYNQTGISLFAIGLLMLTYLVKASKWHRSKYQYLILPAIIAVFAAMIPFFFNRILREGTLVVEGASSGITTFQYYLVAFSNPIFLWLNLSRLDQLWGAAYQFGNLEFADSGYFTTLFLSGILWVIVLTTLVVRTSFRILRTPVARSPNPAATAGRLAVMNAFLSFLWFCSVFHYMPAFLLGGVELFAFHFALSIYCWKVYKAAPPTESSSGDPLPPARRRLRPSRPARAAA